MDDFHCDCGKPKRPHQAACLDCMFAVAAVAYDPERHDPESVFFDDSYVGPSERDLNGGCNRCGGWDDCYCID